MQQRTDLLQLLAGEGELKRVAREFRGAPCFFFGSPEGAKPLGLPCGPARP